MVDMVALGVQPSTFDPMKALLVASQLRQADATNTLANLTIQEREKGINALAEYSRLRKANDPNAVAALDTVPELQNHVIQGQTNQVALKSAQDQQKANRFAKDAWDILQIPDGEERDKAYQQRLAALKNEGILAPERYQALASQKPNDLMLRNLVTAALDPSAMVGQINKQDDRTVARDAGVTLNRVLGGDGNVARPNPGRTVPQTMSGAISPLTAVDPSQGLTDDFRTPLSPTPRLTPQQIADARGTPQLNATTGVQPGPGVPYMDTIGENATYSPAPLGGAVAPAAADAPLTPNMVQTQRITPPSVPPTAQSIIKQAGNPSGAEAPIGSYPEGAPSLGGVPFKKLLPVLISGSMAPVKEVAETYKEVLKSVLDEAKMTGDQKEYWTSMQQYGETNRQRAEQGLKPLDPPSFDIWKRENLSARSAKGETEFNKHLLGAVGKDWAELYKDGMEARKERVMYGRLGDLMERSGTGPNVAFTNWVREWTGAKLGPKADAAEAANAIINFVQPKMRVAGSGSTSDADLRAFGRALPSLLSTPEGKRVIVETLGGMAQYRIGASDVVGDYIANGASDARKGETMQKLSDYSSTTDPFGKFKEWQIAQNGKAGRAPAAAKPIQKGFVDDDGNKFLGGNASDPASWEQPK